MMFSVVWAQDVAGAVPANDMGAVVMSALPFVLVFAVFYFVLLRPQMQAAKDHTKLLADLKKGDGVITDGGLVGKIISLEGGIVHVEVGEGVIVNVTREAVKGLLNDQIVDRMDAKAAKAGKKR